VKFKKLRKEAVAHSSVKKLKTTSTAKKPMVQGKVNLPAKEPTSKKSVVKIKFIAILSI
jgi:hypothetical protein